jgi:hypothetical protein
VNPCVGRLDWSKYPTREPRNPGEKAGRFSGSGLDSGCVFAFVVYAVGVWYAAARWRRRWESFAWILAGFGGLVLVAYFHWRLNIWTHGNIYLPVLRVLLYPYTALVVGVGLFIALLPRRVIPWAHCPACTYDLRGLDAPVESCPECGMTEELGRLTYGRQFKGFPAMPRPDLTPAAPATGRRARAPRAGGRRWRPIGSPAALLRSPDR